jgi:hypothetical protein
MLGSMFISLSLTVNGYQSSDAGSWIVDAG